MVCVEDGKMGRDCEGIWMSESLSTKEEERG